MASRRGSLTLGPTRTPSSSRSSRSYVPFCPSDFFFSSRRRHTRWPRDWSSDECSSDLKSWIRGEVMDFGGTLPSRSIGIMRLAENLEVIYGAQELRGKILSRRHLGPIG